MNSTVDIGDIIKLRNEPFRNHFQANGYPSWSESALYLFQFDHVTLWFNLLQTRAEYAKGFFDSVCSKVINIENDKDGNPLFIETELFWISFPKALTANEIEIIKNEPYEVDPIAQKTISDLEWIETEHSKGNFDVLERENNKLAFYKYGYCRMRFEGRWK